MSAPDVATCGEGPPPLVAATTRGYGCPMPRSRRSRPPKRPSRASRHARATGAYRRAAVNRAEGRIAILTSCHRGPGITRPIVNLAGSGSGFRWFSPDEITGAFEDHGLVEIRREIRGVMQYVGARRP